MEKYLLSLNEIVSLEREEALILWTYSLLEHTKTVFIAEQNQVFTNRAIFIISGDAVTTIGGCNSISIGTTRKQVHTYIALIFIFEQTFVRLKRQKVRFLSFKSECFFWSEGLILPLDNSSPQIKHSSLRTFWIIMDENVNDKYSSQHFVTFPGCETGTVSIISLCGNFS